MKNKLYLFALIAVVLGGLLTGCDDNEDKWSDVMDGADVGGAIPFTRFSTPKIFDVADLGGYKMEYELNVGAVGEGLTYKKVIIRKSFNGGDFIEHSSVNASDIPAKISITAAEALNGFEGVSTDNVKGGDYIDWEYLIEFADGTNGVYNDDAADSFPNFRSFFASSPSGFEVGGEYVCKVTNNGLGNADETIDPYVLTKVPGTAGSQYIFEDITCGSAAKIWGVTVPQRIYYIGNNKFVFNATPEAYAAYFAIVGDVTVDPGSGVITVDAIINGLYGGKAIGFTLTPKK